MCLLCRIVKYGEGRMRLVFFRFVRVCRLDCEILVVDKHSIRDFKLDQFLELVQCLSMAVVRFAIFLTAFVTYLARNKAVRLSQEIS